MTTRPAGVVPSTEMVSVPSARSSSAITNELRETAEAVEVPCAGIVTVTAVPGAVKSAASAVAVPSVPNDRVTTVAELITELVVVPGKEAVTMASPPFPSSSEASVAPKPKVIAESSSTMVSVSGVTVPPAAPPDKVPVTRNVSGPSAMVSLLRVKPVRSTAAPVNAPAAMVMSAAVPGAVKSVPPPVAEAGSSAAAFTDTVVAAPKSETVAVVNWARTRTAGVPSSANSS